MYQSPYLPAGVTQDQLEYDPEEDSLLAEMLAYHSLTLDDWRGMDSTAEELHWEAWDHSLLGLQVSREWMSGEPF